MMGRRWSFASPPRFRGVWKDGSEVQAETDMIPLTYGGQAFA
jgi:hypothetical protein